MTWSDDELSRFTHQDVEGLLAQQWPPAVDVEASAMDTGEQASEEQAGALDDQRFWVDDEDANVRLEEHAAGEAATEGVLRHPINFYEQMFNHHQLPSLPLRRTGAVYDCLELIINGIAKRDGGYKEFDKFVTEWRVVIVNSFVHNATNERGNRLYK